MEYRLPSLAGLASDLRETGASVAAEGGAKRADTAADAVLRVTLDDIERTFVVQYRRRAPYRGELEQLREVQLTCQKFGAPLLVAPTIGPVIARELVAAGWSWADERGNYFLQAPGLRLSRTGQTRELEPTTAKLPGGVAGRRMLRWLINMWDEANPISVTALAEQVGVTQAAGSQIIKQLRELGFVGSKRGLGQVDREALLHEFVRQYPGAGGHVQYAYGLDAPTQIGNRFARRHEDAVAISGDVGPDELAPWRIPTILIVYAREPIELEPLELVPAVGLRDANVFIHYPADLSVFVDYEFPRLRSRSFADPTQMYIDLLRLGGDDRQEAAAKLESWILK
jgi:hypothetical protein